MSETNFTKLFSSITASTVWCESSDIRIVWITMLAMADENGWVYASRPGLANIAQVSLEATKEALDKFLAPDEESRDGENDGRRIEKIDGGWAILNHPKYRKLRNKEERRAYQREYMRARRSVNNPVNNVSKCEPPCTQAEAEADADKHNAPSARVKTPRSSPVPTQEIINNWNEFAEINRLPKVVKPTKALKGQIRQRWTDIPSLEQWDNFFDEIANSTFLSGKAPPGNGRTQPFRATLLWITKETNFAKIAAGEYS